MAKALIVTAKEIEKYGNKDHEEAKKLEKAIQEITDLLWNNSETRKKVVKEYFKAMEAVEDGMENANFEKLYGLMGRIIDDGLKQEDEIMEILEKYEI